MNDEIKNLILSEASVAQPAPSVKESIIDDLQAQFDTEGITESDSGEALIRLSDAIAAVEDNFALAQPAQRVPTGWLRAIDEALVVAHIGVANKSDTYEQAKVKLNNLIGFHVDVATDPAVNGGYKLVSVRLTPRASLPRHIIPEQAPDDMHEYCQEAAEGYADGWNDCMKAIRGEGE